MTRFPGYDSTYSEWQADPQGWWERSPSGIEWEQRWNKVFDPTSGPYGRWFTGGVLDTTVNCLDRHVDAGRGDQAALIWDSPMAGRACPGYDVVAVDDDCVELPHGEAIGNLAVRLPLPPGCSPTLWRDEARFRRGYLEDFPGWYRTGGAGRVDELGDVWVMGRTDDVMNVAGHRFSSAAIEEVLASHPDVAECAVIGAANPLKGQVPMGLVVLKGNATIEIDDLTAELIALVRARIGPIASFRDVHVVTKLPKTRSGKILRATIRTLADGGVPTVPATIDDPAVLEDLRQVLQPTQYFHDIGTIGVSRNASRWYSTAANIDQSNRIPQC